MSDNDLARFWSSTTAQDFQANALYVNFGVGGVSADAKTAKIRARAVRTAP